MGLCLDRIISCANSINFTFPFPLLIHILMRMSEKLPGIGGQRHSSSLAVKEDVGRVSVTMILATGLKSIFPVITGNYSFIFISLKFVLFAWVRAEY